MERGYKRLDSFGGVWYNVFTVGLVCYVHTFEESAKWLFRS